MMIYQFEKELGTATCSVALGLAVVWVVSVPWREPRSLAGDPERFAAVSRRRGRLVGWSIAAVAALWIAANIVIDLWIVAND